ncbi:hypothetical protein ACFX19_023168 [Malus domestica]
MAKKNKNPGRGGYYGSAFGQAGKCSVSSGRIDVEVTGFEDSSALTRKSISLNSSNRDSFGVPIQILPLSNMLSSERKDLKHMLNMENALNAGDMEFCRKCIVAKWSEADGLLASFKLFVCVLCNDSAMAIKVFDHRGYSAKLCIVFLPSLCATLVGISRVMITESWARSLRWRSCRNCHNFDLLLALLTSPKLAGWVGTSSVFPHAGCIEECWRVLIFDHEVKLSSYVICEEHILRVQTRVHQSTSDWKKGEDPELSLYAE